MLISKNKYLWLASAIFLLALFLRLLSIQSFPLWTDEGWTFWLVENQSLADTFAKLLQDRHPPLYFALLTLWQLLAGQSLLALRFLSLIAGMVSLALSFQIAKRIFNERVALYSLFFLSILDISIYYSQELRHYGFFAMMSLLVIVLFLINLRKPSWGTYFAYSMAVLALMLTHYFGLFVMVAQAFYALLLWPEKWQKKASLVAAWFFAALLYLPWLMYSFSTFSSISQGVGNFPNSYQSNPHDLFLIFDLLFAGQLLFFGGLYLIALRHLHWKSLAPYLVLASIGLFALMFIVNLWAGVLSNRMLYYLIPIIMIMCAFGFAQLPASAKQLFLPLIFLLILLKDSNIQPRINADDVASYLAANYNDHDYIILEAGWEDNNLDYEIAQRIPHSERIRTIWLWEPSRIQTTVQAALANYERVWLVNWLHAATILPQLATDTSFQLAHIETILLDEPVPSSDEGIEIYLFERVNTETAFAAYENGLVLQDFIYPETIASDSPFHIDFWWQTQTPLALDYSFNLSFLDESGQIVQQYDAALSSEGSSTWQSNQLVFGRHPINISATLDANQSYELYLTVYHYQNPQNPLQAEGQTQISLGRFQVRN